MIRIGLVGLGKMGLSHQAILGAHPLVEIGGVCDANTFVLDLLGRHSGVDTYADFGKMLDRARLDAVVIATPSRLHASMVSAAIDRGLHVFCEKPFCLTSAEGSALSAAAQARGLVTQVGYHNRFVGTFAEVKRLLDLGVIGPVSHVLAEAYGPVVLRPSGSTWRSRSSEGGGCLYDYAAHPMNLVNWFLGPPTGVGGTALNQVFSREIDDEVSSTLYFGSGATAQISVSWSDESVRKMSTRVSLWGTGGHIYADRQECQVYLREDQIIPSGYTVGWNVKYTTELTEGVDFYLRGEEYSAELDHFVRRVDAGTVEGENNFDSAVVTDRCIEIMQVDAKRGPTTHFIKELHAPAPLPEVSLLTRMKRPVARLLGR